MHPSTVTLTGSFERNGQPVRGFLRFTPSRLWVVRDRTAWACLAPELAIEPDGSFVTRVTATDTDAIPWHYLVDTPAGLFQIEVPWSEDGYSLRGLVGEHRSGPRAPH